MFKKSSIGKWLTHLIFVSILLSVSVNADDINDSEYDEEHPPLPDYGPKLFEEIKNNPKFIAARGTMPEIGEGEEEKQEWVNSLMNCSSFSNLPFKITPYMKANGGSVVTFGCSEMGGYLFVEFDNKTPEKVNESLIDEMYKIIDDHCEQEGIIDVPVVFMWGEVAIEDEEEMAELPGEEIIFDKGEQAKSSDEDKEGTDRETSTHQTPGFTSVMVILGILSFLIVKRL